ncbi:MAG: T9SS type A sorting domain-containing protein [Saprospiraceae bacterium]|nr:T9SS type A sorting domain-containing protein [Saprospiraceae bacterium]
MKWCLVCFSAVFLTTGILLAQPSGSITQGPGTTTVVDLMPNCPSNHITPLGTITSNDGNTWIVPADNHFQTASKLSDLYNSCNGITPPNLAAANLANVPVTEIDPDGEVITGYLFADNYFELYVNGVEVGVDAVPFTPFNSSVVKFRVSQPYTIAVKLVDWEENLGLGSEINNGNLFHPGDGGFIAQFSDGTVTDESWQAQVFYIAPVQDLNTVVELPDGTRSTANATLTPTCNANCYGVHYPVPADWTTENFDETGWVSATLYTAAQVTNQAAFKNFENTAWGNARFIWTSNLVLDNLVLARKTVGATSVKEWGQVEQELIEVFPNPAGDIVSCRIHTASGHDIPVEVVDIHGQVVVSDRLDAGKLQLSFYLSGLPAGVYVIRFLDEAAIYTRKLILK